MNESRTPRPPHPSSADALPHFSVIVPTYARPAQLRRCLDALARLDYPRDRVEVIVVDDGSPEPVDASALRIAGAPTLTVVRQPNAGPARARNAGARAARGSWLAFTDDDCAPAPNWLRAFARAARATPDAILGGTVANVLSDDPYATATDALTRFLYDYLPTRPDAGSFFMTSNIAVRREVFEAVGGFDTRFRRAAGEDREFCDRCTHAGHHLRLVPDADVRHAHALTLGGFVRQHVQYGRGAPYYHRARARRGARAIPVQPVAFYGAMLRHPWRTGAPAPARTAALLVLAQCAYVAGYAWERMASEGGR